MGVDVTADVLFWLGGGLNQGWVLISNSGDGWDFATAETDRGPKLVLTYSATPSASNPTESPTIVPTASPTSFPTTSPTSVPTTSPTSVPTTSPTSDIIDRVLEFTCEENPAFCSADGDDDAELMLLEMFLERYCERDPDSEVCSDECGFLP